MTNGPWIEFSLPDMFRWAKVFSVSIVLAALIAAFFHFLLFGGGWVVGWITKASIGNEATAFVVETPLHDERLVIIRHPQGKSPAQIGSWVLARVSRVEAGDDRQGTIEVDSLVTLPLSQMFSDTLARIGESAPVLFASRPLLIALGIGLLFAGAPLLRGVSALAAATTIAVLTWHLTAVVCLSALSELRFAGVPPLLGAICTMLITWMVTLSPDSTLGRLADRILGLLLFMIAAGPLLARQLDVPSTATAGVGVAASLLSPPRAMILLGTVALTAGLGLSAEATLIALCIVAAAGWVRWLGQQLYLLKTDVGRLAAIFSWKRKEIST